MTCGHHRLIEEEWKDEKQKEIKKLNESWAQSVSKSGFSSAVEQHRNWIRDGNVALKDCANVVR